MKRIVFSILFVFIVLTGCNDNTNKKDPFITLTLLNGDNNNLPLSQTKVSLGISSLKFFLFHHHKEVFQATTNDQGEISFRLEKGKDYWITLYDEKNEIISMHPIENKNIIHNDTISVIIKKIFRPKG